MAPKIRIVRPRGRPRKVRQRFAGPTPGLRRLRTKTANTNIVESNLSTSSASLNPYIDQSAAILPHTARPSTSVSAPRPSTIVETAMASMVPLRDSPSAGARVQGLSQPARYASGRVVLPGFTKRGTARKNLTQIGGVTFRPVSLSGTHPHLASRAPTFAPEARRPLAWMPRPSSSTVVEPVVAVEAGEEREGSPPPLPENKMKRAAAARADQSARRLSRFGELQGRKPSTSAKSALEEIKLLPSTRDAYLKALEGLETWRVQNHLAEATSVDELGFIILERLDDLFFQGANHWEGDTIICAARHFVPDLNSSVLWRDRLRNACKGWGKRAPGQTHAPLPAAAVFAIIECMVFLGLGMAGAFTLMQFLSYMRPGELEALRVSQLIQPIPESGLAQHWCIMIAPLEADNPSKAGEREESIIFDDPSYKWMDSAIFEQLVAGRRPEDPLFPIANDLLRQAWKDATGYLGLSEVAPARYAIRHAGASHDLLSKHRSLEQIKARGRWQCDASMKRYTKVAKAAQAAHKVPKATLEFGVLAEKRLEGLFNGLFRAAKPPRAS